MMNPYYLSDILFFGFAIYSFLFIVFKRFAFYKNNHVFPKIEKAAITVVVLAGLLFAAIWFFYMGKNLLDKDRQSFVQRITGPYGFGYWLPPVLYLISSQLVRIPKIANNSILRFIIAVLLFLNFEKFVIIVTSLHRDYLPSSWTMYGDYSIFGWIAIDWIIKLIVFSSFVTIVYYLQTRKKG